MKRALRKAFTMLELVLVIVVVGILALMALPRVQDDRLYELVDQTVSLIRYTQHLAMQDNPYDPSDPHWAKKRWGIQFVSCQEGYNKFGYKGTPYGFTIFKETNPEGPPRPVFAKDPSNANGYIYSGYVFEYSSGFNIPCDLNMLNRKLDFMTKGVTGIYLNGFAAKFVDEVETGHMINGTSTGKIRITATNCPNAPDSTRTLAFDEKGRPHMPSRLARPYGGDVWHCGGTNIQTSGSAYLYKRYRFIIPGKKQVAKIYIEGETGQITVKYVENKPGSYNYYNWDAEGY